MIAATNSAGNASSAMIVAMKMPQTDSGMRISVMPLVPRLQHRRHIVEAAHGEGDDEDGQAHQHRDDAPCGRACLR